MPKLAELAPKGDRRMGANPHANGGILLRDLKMPDFRIHTVTVPSPGAVDGQVLDSMLSEHQCEGWLEGYLLTGRHGLFNSYESFIRIIDSMFSQHAKWLKVTNELPWRRKIASLNYLLAFHVLQLEMESDQKIERIHFKTRVGERPNGKAMSMTATNPGSLRRYLIRHAETEWALSSRHTGLTDIPLPANGKTQAQTLDNQLLGIRFDHVLTSPLKRARQPCELAGLDKVSIIEPDLTEWDYGDYEGKRTVDIFKKRPDWNIFRDGCPNGEMPARVSERADRLIARLRTMDGKVALLSHGQFGGVLAARWIGLPLIEAWHFPLDTAALSIFSFSPHHPEVPVIDLWNATVSKLISKTRRGNLYYEE